MWVWAAVCITFGFRLVSIRKAIFTHDLELNVGELRRRIDFQMRAQALLGFVLEVLALWLLLLAADLIAKMGQHTIRRRGAQRADRFEGWFT